MQVQAVWLHSADLTSFAEEGEASQAQPLVTIYVSNMALANVMRFWQVTDLRLGIVAHSCNPGP